MVSMRPLLDVMYVDVTVPASSRSMILEGFDILVVGCGNLMERKLLRVGRREGACSMLAA
jgi:hypothetical protein